MKLFASATLLILVAGVGLATAGQSLGHPSSLPKTLPKLCGLPDVEGAVVQFKAGDGANLVGAVAGRTGGRVGVVVANTADGEICNWVSLGGDPKLTNALVADGDQVLFFDYRGTGRSPKTSGSRSSAFDQDVLGAVAELRRRGAKRIVLVGGSVGGIVSLVAATKLKPSPAAIIGLSASGTSPPFTDSDGGTAATKLHAPLLLVVAHDDVLATARSLFKASSAKDKQLLVVPGSSHAFFGLDPSGPKIRARVLTLIRAHTG